MKSKSNDKQTQKGTSGRLLNQGYSSDLPNTTTGVKLTSGKAKIRMLKDGKLVKHKSNHEMIKRSKQENTHVNRQNPDKQ